MTPNEIVREFARKYEGTYVFVQTPNSKEENLFYMQSVTPSDHGGHAVLKLQSEEFGKIQLNMGTAHTIRFAFPKCGTFQHGAHAYRFLREPRRQWQRGLCSGNCRVTPVVANIDRNNPEGTNLTFDIVDAAFKGQVFEYRKAISMLQSGKYRSVAMADNFAVMLSPMKSYEYILLYGIHPIAGIDKDGEVATTLEVAFAPQIKKVVS